MIKTIKGFEIYETMTFLGFLVSAILFLIDALYFATLISVLGAFWVLISSGNRQNFKELLERLS